VLEGALTIYNLTTDFSTTANPNGVWAYELNGIPITATVNNAQLAGWGYSSSFDSSITQDYSQNAENGVNTDLHIGDVLMHAPSVPYGGSGQYGVTGAYLDIAWTSPANGVISVNGMAWDAVFASGRDANWWLSVDGTTIASRSSVYGLERTDSAAQFANNLLPGSSLSGIDVTAGEVVELAVAADTYYGHFVGVQEIITLST